MNIRFVSENGTTTLLIQEERIDIQNAVQLREKLIDLIYKGQNTLLLDLQKVTFIDSSGLGALVYSLREARKYKGSIKIYYK